METRWLLSSSDEVQLNGAYLHAVFDEFNFPLQSPPPRGGVGNATVCVNLVGVSPPSAPKLTGTLSYMHTFELAGERTLDWLLQSHVESQYWLTVDHGATYPGWPTHQRDDKAPALAAAGVEEKSCLGYTISPQAISHWGRNHV